MRRERALEEALRKAEEEQRLHQQQEEEISLQVCRISVMYLRQRQTFPFDVGMVGVTKAFMWTQAPPKPHPLIMRLTLLGENLVISYCKIYTLLSVLSRCRMS